MFKKSLSFKSVAPWAQAGVEEFLQRETKVTGKIENLPGDILAGTLTVQSSSRVDLETALKKLKSDGIFGKLFCE